MIKSILLIVSLSIVGCKSQKTPKQNAAMDTTYVNKTPKAEDCHYPRKTIYTMENENGNIAFIANTYVIVTAEEKRYQPCELPTNYQKEGLSVSFTGDKLEVMAHERRFATPLRLHSISIVHN